jgi:hypothetical protein
MSETVIFPHCDPRILHKPGECQFCDKQPEWQSLRRAWGVNFTGHHDGMNEYGMAFVSCPSEVIRPLERINQWDGNVPYKADTINTEAPMFRGKTVEHDKFSRHVTVTSERVGVIRKIREYLDLL